MRRGGPRQVHPSFLYSPMLGHGEVNRWLFIAFGADGTSPGGITGEQEGILSALKSDEGREEYRDEKKGER